MWRDSIFKVTLLHGELPKSSVFIKSINVSNIVKNTNVLLPKFINVPNIVKDANALMPMHDEMVDYVEEHTMIQIVTDNASNYKKVRLILQVKKPNLFWSPCAPHCIDLMPEDIGKKIYSLTYFIYNEIMRIYTNKRVVYHQICHFHLLV